MKLPDMDITSKMEIMELLARGTCNRAGVTFVGIQPHKGRDLVYFNHHFNESTMGIWYQDGFTVEKIREKIEQCKAKYSKQN